jgi:hypothetical protein
MFSAMTVITTLRITTLNAIDRFDDYRQASEDFQAAWGTSETCETPWYKRPEVWLMLALGLHRVVEHVVRSRRRLRRENGRGSRTRLGSIRG